MTALYILFIAIVSLFGMFVLLFIAASIIDWYHYRNFRTFYELQRDHTKRRRPAAK